MKNSILSVVFIALMVSFSGPSMAWGKKGHEMVAAIAYHYLDAATKEKVKKYLGKYSFEEAGTWMDDARSNSYYEFQRTWHYLDFAKGQEFKPSLEHNIITVLHTAMVDVKKYQEEKKSDVQRQLLLIFHLVGDIHQPLHVGYPEDRGGNDISVRAAKFSANLHSSWDTELIDAGGLTLDSCYKLYDAMSSTEINTIKKIDIMSWMKESRSYLDTVYGFKDNYLDQNYVDNASVIIKKQLLIAGLRLAAILEDAFATKG
jgi:hypothetical protein